MLFMRKFLRSAFLQLGLLLLCTIGYAQERTITGVVTSGGDDSNLPNVTVAVKGTSYATTTDASGRFSISAQKGQTLHISSVGFEAQDVVVGDEISVNIKLTTAQNSLADVVVVGYGTQRKENLTGAVP